MTPNGAWIRGRLVHKWKLKVVPQNEDYAADDLMDLQFKVVSAVPAVTIELWCDGDRVLAFHSPSARTFEGEIYTLKLVDGRAPWDVFNEEMGNA